MRWRNPSKSAEPEWQHNPLPQRIIDDIDPYDQEEYHVLSVIFDYYWEEVADFARQHRVAMPTKYLGAGCTGVALIAGSRVMKILTGALEKMGDPENDLRFARYLATNRLSGFAQVYAILELNIRYWQGVFLDDLKRYAREAKVDPGSTRKLTDNFIQNWDHPDTRYAREAFNDEMLRTKGKGLSSDWGSKQYWKRRVRDLSKRQTPTWIIWLERLQDSDNFIPALARRYRTTHSKVRQQLQLVTDYTKVAMDAFGLDTTELVMVKVRDGYYQSEGGGDSPSSLDDLGQKLSWNKYDKAKDQITTYLNMARNKAPLFGDIISSLHFFLDDDIIISDLRADNIGLKQIGNSLIPTVFDAIVHPLNP